MRNRWNAAWAQDAPHSSATANRLRNPNLLMTPSGARDAWMSRPTASPRRLFRGRRLMTPAVRSPYDARMKRFLQSAALLACLAIAAGAGAAGLTVNEPWVKPVAAGGSTDAYMELTSHEGATIADARSPIAKSVRVVTAKGRKEPPFAVTLPAHTTVMLAAKGTRLSLV